MRRLNALDWVALILVIVGGINWGLIGLFQFNLVAFILGSIPFLVYTAYILVGAAALYMIYYATRDRDPYAPRRTV